MGNLLSNAAKFSPAGSLVEIGMTLHGEQCRVFVKDRGPGIAPEFQSRIFQRFSQAESSDSRAKSGSGLGLAIAKSLVEQMGGTIGYETDLGHGTMFFFYLPILPEAGAKG
jgi:signal transduction histidine kinase